MGSAGLGWKHEWINDCKWKKNMKSNCTQYSLAWMFFTFCSCCKILICLVCIVASFKLFCNCCWFAMCIGLVILCVFVIPCVRCCWFYIYIYIYIYIYTLDTGLLARSQYSEGPATGHLDTGSSWFPSVYKQMLRWFLRFKVATTCFSCSPPDSNLLVTNFMFCLHVK